MKRLYILAVLLFAGMISFAQQNVSLRINHLLGGLPFQFGATATNNVGGEINFNRLEYYISDIKIIHDGGQETPVVDTWILADANNACFQSLGSFPVTNLEGVSFGVGVQQAYNHLDPTTYGPGHPLGLQSPSMQWGWSSGYMFIAIAGNSGSNLSAGYDVQTLGDGNYFHTTVNTTGTMSGQDLIIDLDADYLMGLKNINLSAGPSVHGTTGISVTLAQNFRDHVFSAAVATGITPANSSIGFSIVPNPASGHTRLVVDAAMGEEGHFVVYDYTGRVLREVKPVAGVAELDLNVAGCYFVALQTAEHTMASKRLVVSK